MLAIKKTINSNLIICLVAINCSSIQERERVKYITLKKSLKMYLKNYLNSKNLTISLAENSLYTTL